MNHANDNQDDLFQQTAAEVMIRSPWENVGAMLLTVWGRDE